MTQVDEWIRGKKVLLLGFGREGESTYRVLRASGAYKELAIADLAEGKGRRPAEDIPWICGPDYQKAMDAYDVVFKSPGIVLERPLEEYRCQVLSQTEVFIRLFREQIIGVTGTKGKSTTATLLYHVLKTAGKNVLLVGNIGIPAFDHLEGIDRDTVIVFELSCHQLEYMTVSPHIALLLNIYEEHLDHYGTMEKYVRAKEQIYRHQQPQDTFICGEQCLPADWEGVSRLVAVTDRGEDEDAEQTGDKGTEGCGIEGLEQAGDKVILAGSRVYWKNHCYKIPLEDIRLPGHHNCYDIAFVYAACRLKGVSDEEFTRGLTTYQPLPHRLSFLGEKDGVRYYDDSISTICATTIQALNTLTDADTVLIGGMDRGIDYRELIEYLSASRVGHILLMEATGKRIYREIHEEYPNFGNLEKLVLVKDLREAVEAAKRLTRRGRSCVLSPAAASYGIFKNFEERGDVFRELVFGTEGHLST